MDRSVLNVKPWTQRDHSWSRHCYLNHPLFWWGAGGTHWSLAHAQLLVGRPGLPCILYVRPCSVLCAVTLNHSTRKAGCPRDASAASPQRVCAEVVAVPRRAVMLSCGWHQSWSLVPPGTVLFSKPPAICSCLFQQPSCFLFRSLSNA